MNILCLLGFVSKYLENDVKDCNNNDNDDDDDDDDDKVT